MDQRLYEKIGRFIDTMPSFPTTAFKVIEICENPKTSVADLRKVIALDPVLMAKTLKLINSTYYEMNHEVTSLVHATIVLGLNAVKNLALSTAVMGAIPKEKRNGALDMDEFWRHSLSVGVTAKLLAKKRGIDRKQWEGYFCAGLLHDIGKIPLDTVFGMDYMNAIADADKKREPLVCVENRLFDTDHCQVGQMLAELWKLDRALLDAIIYHHNYSVYDGLHKDKLLTVVAANDYVNFSKLGFSGDMRPNEIDQAVLNELKISKDVFIEMEEEFLSEIEKAKIFLEI
ncbi:MAG: HDOD domain-containing protein [Treponema sp.]|nr:HDOD domain-containing protein [Treponema sp.]